LSSARWSVKQNKLEIMRAVCRYRSIRKASLISKSRCLRLNGGETQKGEQNKSANALKGTG
jgi:hypothetical protein